MADLVNLDLFLRELYQYAAAKIVMTISKSSSSPELMSEDRLGLPDIVSFVQL